MEFIRQRKMEPDYEPNETHCLYGLDADLIMLALASHEPHFMLFREEVNFGKNKSDREKEADQKEQVNIACHRVCLLALLPPLIHPRSVLNGSEIGCEQQQKQAWPEQS